MVDEALKEILRDYIVLRMWHISNGPACLGEFDRIRHASELLGEWPVLSDESDNSDRPDVKWIPLDEWKRLNPWANLEPAL